MRKYLLVAALGCFFTYAGLQASAALAGKGAPGPCLQQEAVLARPVWEYTAVRGTKDKPVKLNDLGAQGWELVAVIQADGGTSFFFKRLRQD